jgi:NTP pyrophosphatase (non-canonical NTP hydrolase)
MEIKELIEKAHENAMKHGFWEDITRLENSYCIVDTLTCATNTDGIKDCKQDLNNAIGNRLMLIVSELAEAQEGLRHNDTANFKEELADVAIRLADLCGGLEIDLEAEILKKMEKNANRPYKHGKQF